MRKCKVEEKNFDERPILFIIQIFYEVDLELLHFIQAMGNLKKND